MTLIVADGRRTGELVPVSGRKFLIGRHAECQLRPGSSTVSQHHCLLRRRDGKVFVKDLDSANGTFVNGERVVDQRELHNEDVLRVGRLTFLVWVEAGKESGEAATPAESSILGLLLKGSAADSSLGLLPEDSECGGTVLDSPEELAKRSRRKRQKDSKSGAASLPALPPAAREILERFQRSN